MSELPSQASQAPQQQTRSFATAPRWMKWLLAASLAVNLLIVGVAIGAALRFQGWRGGGGLADRIERFAQQLPAERRDAVLEIIRTRSPEIRSLAQEARAARRELASLIENETFDPVAFSRQGKVTEEAYGQLRGQMTSVLGDIASRLSAEERRELLRYWRRRGWRR